MIGLIVTGHGHFASGLGSALKLITGITQNVVLVDFEEEDTTEVLMGKINLALDELSGCEGVLVLSDLAGGSPFKAAVECRFARPQQKIEVIAGANMPMLIEGGMMMASFENPCEMAESLLVTGREYILRFELKEHEDRQEEGGI